MDKLYKAAYWSASIILMLGAIFLDEHIHPFARVCAGLLSTSPYWLQYFRLATGPKAHQEECEHEFVVRDSYGSEPYTVCTKCGLKG